MAELFPCAVLPLIRQALAEDRARHDITSAAIIPASTRIEACIIARAPGVVAGVKIAGLTFATLDPSLRCRQHVRSGARVRPGQEILTITGRARSIFAAERTALNFLMHLSGVATLTRAFVDRAKGTRAKIYDTRKTVPGLRDLQKDAVRAGGGHNHRSDLAEAILMKTNHVRAQRRVRQQSTVDSPEIIRELIAKAKRNRPKRFVEIEVTNLREFTAALESRPDAILLDNWSVPAIWKALAVRHRGPWAVDRGPLIEVSGHVMLANVRAIAKTGVDRISIGRLTHSAPALDFSLKVMP